MDAQGSPPSLDLFKTMAAHLIRNRADEDGDLSIAAFGQNRLRGFSSRHSELSTRYSTNVDKQWALASDPKLITANFEKLKILLRKTQVQAAQHVQYGREGFAW